MQVDAGRSHTYIYYGAFIQRNIHSCEVNPGSAKILQVQVSFKNKHVSCHSKKMIFHCELHDYFALKQSLTLTLNQH